MYNWYEGSKVCYAYSADLGPRDWNVEPATFLKPSRWFTRGWTLQELLAPSYIVFYASDWSYFGTKSHHESLSKELALLTGIGRPSLFFFENRTDASVAPKMSWAAARETNRPEDMTYCLMGFFNINMRLQFGQGAEAAFTRLQEEILRANNDQSIFAWSCRDDVAWQQAHQTHWTQFSSLLADCPGRFADAGAIDSVRDDPEPYATTNLGLQINFELQRADDGLYGLLECMYRAGGHTRIAVPLAEPFSYDCAIFDAGLDNTTWYECLSHLSKPMKRITRDNT